MRSNVDNLIAIGCFGIACAIGLVGAFVGLETHGFWFDELFTARILEPIDGSSLISRIVTDVHPPIYLVALSFYSGLVGDGDAALRSFSALSACAAIVVFVAGTKRSLSLPARLFGAAMATGSLFWFFQAQNARSYALCLLFSAGILALCLSLLVEPRRGERAKLVALLLLMFTGSFVHFYVMYESLAALAVLALLRRERRYTMLAAAAALMIASALYVKLVIVPFSRVDLGNNWYANDPTWYYLVLKSCVQYSFGDAGLVALGLCAAGFVFSRIGSPARSFDSSAPSSRPDSLDRFPVDSVTTFLVGVPLLVLLGGIVSSTILAPNFFDRNFLIVSPFAWAFSARLYDAAMANTPRLVRTALNIALASIVLAMASIVTLRLPSENAPAMYEPFRQSAHWIRTLPECRGQLVPVISTDNSRWYKPGYAELIYTSGYGRYLRGYAQPRLVFTEQIRARRLPEGLARELQRRLDGDGCPVVAWAAHNVSPEAMSAAKAALLQSLGRSMAAAAVETKEFRDGSMGFVLYRKP